MQEGQFVPRQLQPYQELVAQFLSNFNSVCQETGRNYIVKERYEFFEGVSHKRYSVIYKSQYSHRKWLIYGEYRKFLVFKKQFPLFEIHILGSKENRYFSFLGLYTEGLQNIPFETQSLLEALVDYKNNCMRVPIESFTKD
jgi:hypothetical protein